MDSPRAYTMTDWLHVLPEWLSAIGTLLAVMVALYLSRRDRQIRCVASASVYALVGPDVPAEEFVLVTVINIGTRVFTVSGVSWRMGIFKKKYFMQLPVQDVYSSSIPVELTDGKQARVCIPLRDFRANTRSTLMNDAPIHFRSFWTRFARIIVHSTTGENFTFRIHKSVRVEMLSRR